MGVPDTGQRLATAAEVLIGSPFRLHGRDPTTGLDCVGLLAAATTAIGRSQRWPDGYAMKMRSIAHFVRRAGAFGFKPAIGAMMVGDVIIYRAGPCQFHFAIVACDGGFIHAHAGLRRVIHAAELPDWPIEGHWRLAPAPPDFS